MMLDIEKRPLTVEQPQSSDGEELGRLKDSARLFLSRHLFVVLAMTVVGIAAAIAYLFLATPSYTAVAIIDVANRESAFLRQQATVTGAPSDVQRDMATLKSTAVAERVVQRLRLDEDPRYNGTSRNWITIAKAWLANYTKLEALQDIAPSDPQAAGLHAATLALQDHMKVSGVGSGTAIQISFSSSDPRHSADVANAIAESFIVIQSGAEDEIRQKANAWLIKQSTEFRQRADEAQAAVSAFEKTNHLVTVNGKIFDQQILTEIGNRVSAARTTLIDAKYKYEKITGVINDIAHKDILTATSAPEILGDPTIARARDRYIDLSNEVDNIQKNFGKDSQKLRDLMASAKSDILQELPRLADSAKNDYDLASQHYDALVAEQKADNEAAQRASVLENQLNQLQSQVDNYRTLYDNFVQHSAGSSQEVSFPASSARISERATPPLDKTWPKSQIVLLIGCIGGLALGMASGVMRDVADRTFRTTAKVEGVTDLDCLAMVPQSHTSKAALRNSALPAEVLKRIYDVQSIPIWWNIKTAPHSRFSAEMVSASLAVRSFMRGHGASVVAMTSAVPGEGKTTLMISLAILMAQSGFNVAVLDLDLHLPALSQSLAPEGGLGLSDVIAGRCLLDEALREDAALGLTFMTAGSDIDKINPVDILTAKKLRAAIAQLRKKYDCILIDLPPLVPIADVRATADFVDGYVMAIEWGKTNRSVVMRAVNSYNEIRGKYIGAILNKVNFKSLEKYDVVAPMYYSMSNYRQYRNNN